MDSIEGTDGNVEMKHLVTFLEVARSMSFTRAADELGYVQSSVTSHIKTLESDLGAELFERLGRRIVLTAAGEELRGHARRMVNYADEVREAVLQAGGDQREVRGTLHIAAPESLCAYRLPAVLRALQDRYPLLRVVFRPAGRTALLAALKDGGVDVGFLLERNVAAPMTTAELMAEEPLLLVARPGHPLAERKRVHSGQLAGETLLVIEKGCAQREMIDAELKEAEVDPVLMEFVSVEAIKKCAAAGLGVALLPASTVHDEAARGELQILPWTRAPHLGVYMITHKSRRQTRALSDLAALARDLWGEEPDPAADSAASTT
ncbi:DNA-binding transcriptional LysR family regulator [Streptomyces sp. Amel2xB2]|uniref:LysR family transcriptional regulator n=1 Tax=Streptomyces sp. Amel2xB2 TaxID=1305829 RepID=UPI000DC00205|nr:LysR family transcriptional regulator [Streptomyces sp. Amel2xB2]RAJ58368.1 DNA-binding transcriptional LysR family regulator [Streptomyces sp. Amel2xB2]